MIPKKAMNPKNTKPEFHWTVTVWTKGQIVIPKHIRDEFWISSWDRLVTVTKWNMIFWFIKSDDFPKIKEYMEQEMKHCK